MTLVIAVGNTERGDDGAARAVFPLLREGIFRQMQVIELLPELAVEIAQAPEVVIVDADCSSVEVTMEELGPPLQAPQSLSHNLRAEELVALARILYKFEGRAWICRIPGSNFDEGVGLSAGAARNVRRAAELIDGLQR